MARDESADRELMLHGWTLAEEGNNALVIVPPHMVHEMADGVSRFIKSAVKHGLGGYEPDYYLKMCATNRATISVGIEGSFLKGAMVTMPIEYPGYTAASCCYLRWPSWEPDDIPFYGLEGSM